MYGILLIGIIVTIATVFSDRIKVYFIDITTEIVTRLIANGTISKVMEMISILKSGSVKTEKDVKINNNIMWVSYGDYTIPIKYKVRSPVYTVRMYKGENITQFKTRGVRVDLSPFELNVDRVEVENIKGSVREYKGDEKIEL